LRHHREDRLNNAVEVLFDLIVPKAKHMIAVFIQIGGSAIVMTKSGDVPVLLTIELDDEPKGMIGEIRHIGADWGLAAEMTLRQFHEPQGSP